MKKLFYCQRNVAGSVSGCVKKCSILATQSTVLALDGLEALWESGKQRHSGLQRCEKASHAKQKWAEDMLCFMFSLCAMFSPVSRPCKGSSVSWV